MSQFCVDFSKKIGPIKPMHCVNNGPVTYGGLTDTTESFRDAGFPMVRLHDPDWPNPYQVDIPKVFPDWDADEQDPASYRFSQTDDLIAAIYASGAEPLYRLGVSIEHVREKIYAVKPEDFDKWARICVQVIRHYNEGWADGFRYGIRFWEIWNEADGGVSMWTGGTFAEYCALYVTASKAIKAACPDVLVGGYAATSVDWKDKMDVFFSAVRDSGAPLDFFSWHKYSSGGNVDDYVRSAELVRSYLEEYGYPNALSVLDEWNYMTPEAWSSVREKGGKLERRRLFEQCKNMLGCSFCAAAMIALQNSPLDVLMYYDAQPHMLWGGLFDMYGVETKTFYGFKAYNELYRAGTQAACSGGESGVRVLAAVGEDGGRVLLANHAQPEETVELRMSGVPAGARVTLYRLDDAYDLEPDTVDYPAGETFSKFIKVKTDSVLLLKIEK